jgi:hypothetical protein
MDDPKFIMKINEVARQMGESHLAYDSVIRSIKSSASLEQSLSGLYSRLALENRAIESIGVTFREMHQANEFSLSLRAMAEANSSLKLMFESTKFAESVRLSAIANQETWVKEMAQGLREMTRMTEITVRRDLSAVLSASLAAQSKFSELQSYNMGALIHATAPLQESLRSTLEGFAVSYRTLFDFMQQSPVSMIEPRIIHYPPQEAFREATLLEEITIPETEQPVLDEFEAPVVPEETSLEELLANVDAGLPALLQGARKALNTANPDRGRHVVTSIRELFTHVLHHLAPDDKIRDWTSDDHHYNNGRPTRQARLLYINRSINIGALTTFVDSDVGSALNLVKALQAGTHEITSRLTDRQLRAIVDRMEFLLLFLLRLNSTNEE